MAGRFDYFVVFAEMRTGSNFLESTLNETTGITCHGEVFNPHFVGYPGKSSLFGTRIEAREANPLALIERLKQQTEGIAGFRFFHNHDPRVLQKCLSDDRCGKIILTRNLLDTYISYKIVQQTDQWQLNDLEQAKTAKIIFDPAEFTAYVAVRQEFQKTLQHGLQVNGQSAFNISYDDLTNVDVLNGLLRFIGVSDIIKSVSTKTKKQNPNSLQENVTNFAEMEQALAAMDPSTLNPTPNFEPHRGAGVPGYIAAKRSPLLFMPIPSGPTEPVSQWLAQVDQAQTGDLKREFTQKTLRQWKRQSGDHRSFTVIRHPVTRLHMAFVHRILMPGPAQFVEIREVLRNYYKLPIPAEITGDNYSKDDHRKAFIAFAQFIKGNLNAQSSMRVDGSWASQSEIINGMGQFTLPDHIFREEDLQTSLNQLAEGFGLQSPDLVDAAETGPYALADIYDTDVEAAVKAAYQRDYMMFGYRGWA